MSEAIYDRPVVAPAVPTGLRRVSWGAIFAGAILTLVIQIMLSLLGVGIGLATLDPAGNGSPDAATLGSAGGIWTIVT
ncbi:MAG: PhnA-like protein, partial [Hyphomicrobiales bacterium]